jgi:hypothetical protein
MKTDTMIAEEKRYEKQGSREKKKVNCEMLEMNCRMRKTKQTWKTGHQKIQHRESLSNETTFFPSAAKRQINQFVIITLTIREEQKLFIGYVWQHSITLPFCL